MSKEGALVLDLDFNKLEKIGALKAGVILAVVQDADTKDVLVAAYMNRLALEETLRTGIVTFWSTSRNKLWVKGATSGDYLTLVEVRVNCDQNSLLVLARPAGKDKGVCHFKDPQNKAYQTCYYRRVVSAGETWVLEFLKKF
jgi:phosphoribosyl-AMP cyclohydrolase